MKESFTLLMLLLNSILKRVVEQGLKFYIGTIRDDNCIKGFAINILDDIEFPGDNEVVGVVYLEEKENGVKIDVEIVAEAYAKVVDEIVKDSMKNIE